MLAGLGFCFLRYTVLYFTFSGLYFHVALHCQHIGLSALLIIFQRILTHVCLQLSLFICVNHICSQLVCVCFFPKKQLSPYYFVCGVNATNSENCIWACSSTISAVVLSTTVCFFVCLFFVVLFSFIIIIIIIISLFSVSFSFLPLREMA